MISICMKKYEGSQLCVTSDTLVLMPGKEQDPRKLAEEPRFTLRDGEFHPAVDRAFKIISFCMNDDPERWAMIVGAMDTTAIEGNRLSEVCLGTIQKLRNREKVGERYVLGLALTLICLEGAGFDPPSVAHALYLLDQSQK